MASAEKPSIAGRLKGFGHSVVRFLREVRAEFRKVQWPSRREITVYTIVVIASVAVVAVFLGLIDLGLSVIVNQLIKTAA